MKLSQKGNKFFNKILQSYPLPTLQEAKQDQENITNKTIKDQMQPFAHMHDHRKERQIYDRPTAQKLQNMKYFKEIGNQKFKQQNYEQASYFYQKAIVYADYTFPQKKQEIADMQLITQLANMNLAICLIKQDRWDKVDTYLREACRNGSQIQNFDKTKTLGLKTRLKAYYWKCKFELRKQEFEQANRAIQKLEQLEKLGHINTASEVKELRQQIESETRKYQTSSKEVSKKMFT